MSVMRPLVGNQTMSVDRLAGCIKSAQAAGQPGAYHAGQHVTGPAVAKPGIAGGIDDQHLIGAAMTVPEPLRATTQPKRSANVGAAVNRFSEPRRARAQQACRFERTGGEHAGQVSPTACDQQGLELCVFRYSIDSVCINNDEG